MEEGEYTNLQPTVQTHQFNHRRLQDLRTASASLDAQIKDTLRLLANTRKELVSTPATVFPDGARHYYDIDYDELLRYARIISKTTMPPVLPAEPGISAAAVPGEGVGVGGGGGSGIETAVTTPGGMATPGGGGNGGATPNGVQSSSAGAATNGMATPLPSQQSSSTNEPPPSSQQPPISTAGTSFNTVASTNTNTTLPDHINAHLNPQAAFEFAPWPGEDGVRGGGLAALAFLADRGVDPEGYDPEEEKKRREREEEEEKRKREEREREDRERRTREEQARLRARESEQAEAWRRASVVGGPGPGPGGVGGAAGVVPASSPTGEKRQFQFMGDLDDDDD